MSRSPAARVTLAICASLGSALAPAWAGASWQEEATRAYAEVLRRVVTAEGRVRYAALRAEPAPLDAHLANVAAVPAAALEAASEPDRIAFLINAYNAITLKTVAENDPIRPRGLAALRFPANSIRQIPDAWSDRRWTVAGRTVSLDDIEHRTLRVRFSEPRIHAALVCAALGCPPLRTEPYDGARLAEQLDDQARRYLASPAGLQLRDGGRTVAVSAIFTWFAADFDSVGGVRAFLARHAPDAARAALADAGTRIAFLDYDWSLNEAPPANPDRR
ncbi:MAG: DUF547 domain-containing protein [Acidobacteriota bacterium]